MKLRVYFLILLIMISLQKFNAISKPMSGQLKLQYGDLRPFLIGISPLNYFARDKETMPAVAKLAKKMGYTNVSFCGVFLTADPNSIFILLSDDLHKVSNERSLLLFSINRKSGSSKYVRSFTYRLIRTVAFANELSRFDRFSFQKSMNYSSSKKNNLLISESILDSALRSNREFNDVMRFKGCIPYKDGRMIYYLETAFLYAKPVAKRRLYVSDKSNKSIEFCCEFDESMNIDVMNSVLNSNTLEQLPKHSFLELIKAPKCRLSDIDPRLVGGAAVYAEIRLKFPCSDPDVRGWKHGPLLITLYSLKSYDRCAFFMTNKGRTKLEAVWLR